MTDPKSIQKEDIDKAKLFLKYGVKSTGCNEVKTLQTALEALDELTKVRGENEDLKDLLFTRDSYIEELKDILASSGRVDDLYDKLVKENTELRELPIAIANIFFMQLKGLYAADPISALEAISDMLKDRDATISKLQAELSRATHDKEAVLDALEQAKIERDNLKQVISELPSKEEIEKIIKLKLLQMLVQDKPDENGWTKARILATAIHSRIRKE